MRTHTHTCVFCGFWFWFWFWFYGLIGLGSDGNKESSSLPGPSLKGVLPLYREVFSVFYCLGQLGQCVHV